MIQSIALIAGAAALLFSAAGTLAWPGAWVFLIEITGLAIGMSLLPNRCRFAGLLPSRTASPTQGLFHQTYAAMAYIAWLTFMALDAARFHWSEVPLWLQATGANGIFLSVYLAYLIFRKGARAIPSFHHVRNTMHAGNVLSLVGTALLLGSFWGLALVPILFFLLSRMESAPGTVGYGHVPYRYRLVPFIW